METETPEQKSEAAEPESDSQAQVLASPTGAPGPSLPRSTYRYRQTPVENSVSTNRFYRYRAMLVTEN